jgi:hypothetical protein
VRIVTVHGELVHEAKKKNGRKIWREVVAIYWGGNEDRASF